MQIADNANDGAPGLRTAQAHLSANRIRAAPHLGGRRCRNNNDAARSRRVVVAEDGAQQHGDAEHAEVFRRDAIVFHAGIVRGIGLHPARCVKSPAVADASTRPRERDLPAQRDVGNTRQHLQPLDRAVLESHQRGVIGELPARQREVERQNPLGVEAGVDSGQRGHGSNHQACPGQQRDGECQVRHHEGSASTSAAGRGPPARGNRRPMIATLPRRQHSEQAGRDDGDHGREDQHARIDDGMLQARKRNRRNRRQAPDPGNRDRQFAAGGSRRRRAAGSRSAVGGTRAPAAGSQRDAPERARARGQHPAPGEDSPRWRTR